MPANHSSYSLGRLYDFLRANLGETRFVDEDRLDVRALASAAGTSDKALYKAFKEERLTPRAAQKLVQASGGKVLGADLVPFVIG